MSENRQVKFSTMKAHIFIQILTRWAKHIRIKIIRKSKKPFKCSSLSNFDESFYCKFEKFNSHFYKVWRIEFRGGSAFKQTTTDHCLIPTDFHVASKLAIYRSLPFSCNSSPFIYLPAASLCISMEMRTSSDQNGKKFDLSGLSRFFATRVSVVQINLSLRLHAFRGGWGAGKVAKTG